MAKILVSGLINLETTLRVEKFPIDYSPVLYPFNRIASSVSGVGYNVAKALTMLGNDVQFLSVIGNDVSGLIVKTALQSDQIRGDLVLNIVSETPQSVILYDGSGKRQIHVDLKNLQDITYPEKMFELAAASCNWCVLCNINFSRPMLLRARELRKRIATDVHAISDLEDAYNREFMEAADVLFMSDERLSVSPEDWGKVILERYPAEIVVIGLGSRGALLCKRDSSFTLFPAIQVRPVVNTVGAGDALFSGFLHKYIETHNAEAAMQNAMIFAAYKIGAASASEGFLDSVSLDQLWKNR